MEKVQIASFGGVEVLQYNIDAPMPKVQQGEMLIKVHASGVNPIDAKIRNGTSFVCQSLALPSGLGYEISGEIIDLDNDITAFHIGQKVISRLDFSVPNGYSEYVLVKPENTVIKPEGVPYEAGASLPIAALTAWQALFTHGQMKKGERVLIHAGAGGVGHIAIQLAKLKGAYVITTASKRNHEFVKSLGADEIIDYTQVEFYKVLDDIDLVIDLVGGDTGVHSLDVVGKTGKVVTVPSVTKDRVLDQAKEKGVNACTMIASMDLQELNLLCDLIVKGALHIHISKKLTFKAAAEAHQLLESGHTVGKLVLCP